MQLWLDDERNPYLRYWQRQFSYLTAGEWIWVKHAKLAMHYLDRGVVKRISLDHDLGHPLSGYDVACHIERLAFDKKIGAIQWHVHSANSVGSANIVRALTMANSFWGI